MNYHGFWNFFNSFAYPQLAHRAKTFKYAFEYLTSLNREVCIVETGCVRNVGTYAGEGQSTVLFDKFSEFIDGTVVHSVDINPKNTELCRGIVSPRVNVHTMDSVKFLHESCAPLIRPFSSIDLLYLDSYDVDFENPHDSALHHMKELLAARPLITNNTLILLDDSPSYATFILNESGVNLTSPQKVGGKGKYISEFMSDLGIMPVIQSYQIGWRGL
jgi:hypothetical protein